VSDECEANNAKWGVSDFNLSTCSQECCSFLVLVALSLVFDPPKSSAEIWRVTILVSA
jgi:hypothetical protein